MEQLSDTVRNARLDQYETSIGTSPILEIRTGAPPANCAAADSGTLLVPYTLPSDWMAAASGASKSKSGTWSANAVAGGTAGHYRIKNSAGTVCHAQGNIYQAVSLTTNGSTAANANVLNFAATTGVVVGMKVSGTGILPDTYVLAVTSTTVTISRASTAGVSNGASITFDGDLTLNNVVIANGQTVTIDTFTRTEGNA